jgi:GDSL-like Lipase/Acylhydrolase family
VIWFDHGGSVCGARQLVRGRARGGAATSGQSAAGRALGEQLREPGRLPRPLRSLPSARREAAETDARTGERLDGLAATFDRLLTEVRRRAPGARVVLVDYLTILPPDSSTPTGRLPAPVASWGRSVASRLSAETRAAAGRHGCGFVAASEAGRDRHAWSASPWTRRYDLLPGLLRDGAPFHPNRAGMRAVADMTADVLSGPA